MDAAPLQLSGLISHGMDSDAVAADWPALTIEETRAVLAHYPQTGTVEHLVWHSPRPFSAACVVHTSVGNVLIKRHHHSIRTPAQLHEEHGFIRHLHGNHISVSVPLTTSEATSAITLGDWTYEVFWRATGCDIYRDAMSWTAFQSTHHACEAGKTLAQVHLAAVGYDAPERHMHALVSGFCLFGQADPVAAMATLIEQTPAIADYLAQRDWQTEVKGALIPFHRALQPFMDEFTPLWAHNDWHASNLLWSDNTRTASVSTIMDFGLANRTSALFDLATAIERNVIDWLNSPQTNTNMVHTDQLTALLDGYHSINPLSSRQYQALAAILPLVHTDFALSELAYFNGITGSPKNAYLAYDGYFLGHADWFTQTQGQTLLSAIATRGS